MFENLFRAMEKLHREDEEERDYDSYEYDYDDEEIFHFSKKLMDPESGISYDHPTQKLTFRIISTLTEPEVYGNKWIGISDLRNKYLRVSGFFNTSRDIGIKILHVGFIKGNRQNNSFFDFRNAKILDKNQSISSGFGFAPSYVHKIEDKEINYGQ